MSDDLRRFLANARGTAATAKVLSLDELGLQRGATPVDESCDAWGLPALRGRLVEVSARGPSATLTTAMDIVLEAQAAAEPVGWITLTNGSFYPPDASSAGIDLDALVIVRAIDAATVARAAERLLRSGAFGLVVLDLGDAGELSMVQQGRLVTLAQAHDAAVLCLTEKTADKTSVGSLVSLRVEAIRARFDGNQHELTLHALKDKRRGPGWSRKRKVSGPAGLG